MADVAEVASPRGSPLTVAVDAMGGDRGPGEVVAGAVRAADQLGVRVLLVGREDDVAPHLPPGSARVELVTASEHQAGAAEARVRAIRWYERILREAPTSEEARHARRVIVLITAGVDTGERGFYSVYA